MDNIKENLAKNLVNYRKKANLTQLDVAKYLNYSDKAVSKWECADAIPDLIVLKKIADLYGVKIDMLISEPKTPVLLNSRLITKKRAIICSSAIFLVWLIATILFSFINLIIPHITDTWIFFVYAVPVTLVVLQILTSAWGKSVANLVLSSVLNWVTLGSVFLSLTLWIQPPQSQFWMIFLIGIPVQFLLCLYYLYKNVRIKIKNIK